MAAESQLVLSGNAYNNFANTIKSEYTLKDYNRAMKRFMLYMNITDIDNLLLFSNEKEIQHKIIDYVLDLKNKGLSAASIAHYVGAIMHFYAMNDVTLNRKRIGRFIPEHIRKQKDRAYTTQEISRLLEFCDLRDRSIVL